MVLNLHQLCLHHIICLEKFLPRDPTADIKEGMISGMMMHLSICRKSLPMNATYIASRSVHGSALVRKHT